MFTPHVAAAAAELAWSFPTATSETDATASSRPPYNLRRAAQVPILLAPQAMSPLGILGCPL